MFWVYFGLSSLAGVLPFGLGWQPVSMLAIAHVHSLQKDLYVVPGNAVHRKRIAFEVAGCITGLRTLFRGMNRARFRVRICHHRPPLCLRHLELAHLEFARDADAVRRS